MNNLEKQLAEHRANMRKANARSHVKFALKTGKLARNPCEICGAGPTDAHHDDYSKPLEVRWLCSKCHTAHHFPPKPEQPIIPQDQMPSPEMFRQMMRFMGRLGGKAGTGKAKARDPKKMSKAGKKGARARWGRK